MKMIKWVYILPLSCLLSSCFLGEEMPPDQQVWEYSYPTEAGLNDQSLSAMDQAIKDENYGLINGIIIIKDDQLVFENYYNFSNRAEKHEIGRVTFSVLTLALNQFIEEGYISLDAPIMDYLPDYQSVFTNDSLKKLITIRDLISFKAGLVWNETLPLRNDLYRMKNAADWVGYVLNQPMEAPPGRRTVVNSGLGLVLARILQNQLGGTEELKDYLNEQLFGRIGIDQVEWETSPKGTLNGCNGLKMSTIDLTRIGYMLLKEGRWENKQRIINRDWVLEVTSEKSQVDQSYSYGYTWWKFSNNFNNAWLRIPENSTYFTGGEKGQNLYILPSENMVICIMGENYNIDFYNLSLSLFVLSLESLEPAATN